MGLDPLLPIPSGVSLTWGVTHSGLRPCQCALLYVGVLSL